MIALTALGCKNAIDDDPMDFPGILQSNIRKKFLSSVEQLVMTPTP